MAKYPNLTAQSLMSQENLKCEDIRVANNRARLNYNLLDTCSDTNCSYRHTKAKPTDESIKAVKIKLESAIESYVAEGGLQEKNASG